MDKTKLTIEYGREMAEQSREYYSEEYGDNDFTDEMIEQDLIGMGFSQTEVNLILETLEN